MEKLIELGGFPRACCKWCKNIRNYKDNTW